MTYDAFISLIQQPETVREEHLYDLREISDQYPYFIQARILLIKTLYLSNNIRFEADLKLAATYSTNRKKLYYYIFPEQKLATEPYRRESTGKSSGDYFELIERIEKQGSDTRQSLQLLAERLKSARTMVVGSQPQKPVKSVSSIAADTINVDSEVADELSLPQRKANVFNHEKNKDESDVKILIKQHKYPEAIEILKVLNLNNPKKSVYFADQIRFLEKVISITKK